MLSVLCCISKLRNSLLSNSPLPAFTQFISRISKSFCVFSREILSVFFDCLTSQPVFVQILKSFSLLLFMFSSLTMSNSEQRMREQNTRKELLFNPLQLFMFVETELSAAWNFSSFFFSTTRIKKKLFLTRSFHAGCDVTAVYPRSTTKLTRNVDIVLSTKLMLSSLI